MRKWLLALSLAGLLAVSAICVFWLEEDSLKIPVISAKKAQKIESGTLLDGEKINFDLTFDGVTLPYDAASNTYFLPLSMDTPEWEAGKIEASEGVQIFFSEDFSGQDKLSVMKENRSIPFYAVTKEGYSKGNLKITGLPVLTFLGTEHVTEQGEVLFGLTLYETDHTGDWVTDCLTTSTLRGNTSLAYDKKSLRLKLKKQSKDGTFEKANKNLLGIRDDDDWILNSIYADNSRIRDKLAMELWQEVGAFENPYGQNFGMTGEYVEVIINGGYAGLYLLTHPIDRKQLGMDSVSGQLASGKSVVERIYKKKYTAFWNSSDFTGDLPDPNMKDYRGGFYLKGDLVLANEAEWEPLYDMAVCMESEDAVFKEKITELADVSNILDNWLFFQAIAGFDNENKNVYYVSRQKGTDSYGYFVPWDLNISFGAVFADNKYYCRETMEELETLVAFQPGMRVVETGAGDAKMQIQTKWARWREEAFATERVLGRMEELMEDLTLSGAMKREMERWPEGNADPDISFMKDFTAKRLAFLDAYVEEME